jgi:hypothetical protein
LNEQLLDVDPKAGPKGWSSNRDFSPVGAYIGEHKRGTVSAKIVEWIGDVGSVFHGTDLREYLTQEVDMEEVVNSTGSGHNDLEGSGSLSSSSWQELGGEVDKCHQRNTALT